MSKIETIRWKLIQHDIRYKSYGFLGKPKYHVYSVWKAILSTDVKVEDKECSRDFISINKAINYYKSIHEEQSNE